MKNINLKESLFKELEFKNFKINNRVVMAPMTRSRTKDNDVPTAIMAKYYEQRASAGLIITEGAPISINARGYSLTPGIYTKDQINGWKQVTKAVHKKGGKIFIQLWHVGRRSHSAITGLTPLAPSAKKVADKVFGPLKEGGYGMIETEVPKAMTKEDIQSTVKDFAQSAQSAIEAGFDGVEIHGAHGYLIDQFLRSDSNNRTDEYGGDQENRMRFALEVVNAVVDQIGADKVSIRLSPFVSEGAEGVHDPEIVELTLKLLRKLQKMNLAYVHFSENISNHKEIPESFRKEVREVYTNPIMVCGKYTKDSGNKIIQNGYADMVAYGQPFITNPDLVTRFKNNYPLTELRSNSHATFYGGGEEGYTDYLTYEEMKIKK
nr:alkene reductase [Tenacibaculum mesophilum]